MLKLLLSCSVSQQTMPRSGQIMYVDSVNRNAGGTQKWYHTSRGTPFRHRSLGRLVAWALPRPASVRGRLILYIFSFQPLSAADSPCATRAEARRRWRPPGRPRLRRRLRCCIHPAGLCRYAIPPWQGTRPAMEG